MALPPVEAPPAPVTAGSEPEAKTSVWKKEISFGRKSKPTVESTSAPVAMRRAQPAEAAVPPVSPTPEAAVPVAPLPPSRRRSSRAPDPVPSDSSEPRRPPRGRGRSGAAARVAHSRAGAAGRPVAAQPDVPPAVPVAEPPRSTPRRQPPSRGRGRAPPSRRRGRRAEPVDDPQVEPPSEAPSKQSRRERREAKRSLDKASKEHGQLVGLKLGASQIAAAQVVNKGGPKIVRMAAHAARAGRRRRRRAA